MNDNITISLHVGRTPSPEEYYAGIAPSFTAYDIKVPKDNIPKELLDIMKGKVDNKSIVSIAIHKIE